MKKTDSDEMRDEYDFSSKAGAVRGKYVESFNKGTNLVLLDDDVSEVFPDAKSVNDALRSLIKLARAKTKSKKAA